MVPAVAVDMPFTVAMERLNVANGWLCLCLGLPLNALLIWLVVRRSPEELRVYRKVLLITALIDSFFLLMTVWVQPVSPPPPTAPSTLQHAYILQMVLVDSGVMVFYSVGLYSHVVVDNYSHAWNCVWLVAAMNTMLFVHFSIPVPFIYRYLVLVRQVEVPLPTYLLMLCVSALLTVPIIVTNCLINFPTDESQHTLESTLMGGQSRAFGIVGDMRPVTNYYICIAAVGTAIVVVLNSRIWRHINASMQMITSAVQSQTREMNRQIQAVLVLQALVPLVTEILPGTLSYFELLLVRTSSNWTRVSSLLSTLPVSWMPVINPLTTILLIRAYRNVVFGKVLPVRCAARSIRQATKVSVAARSSGLVGADELYRGGGSRAE